MGPLARAYDFVIMALAALAGAMVAGIFVAITYDVTVRTLGLQPPYWTSAATEYALLYITMLAAPWLVRRRGHVFVQVVTLALPSRARRLAEKSVYLVCIALSLTLCYFAADMGAETYARGEIDIRSIDLPRWLLFAAFPVPFFLTATEFARYLFGAASMYDRDPAGSESL